jgi:hypothetical protein
VRVTLIALAAGAFLGGLVTQGAAPVRRLAAIGVAVAVGYGGLLLALVDPRHGMDSDTAVGVAVIAVAGGLLAIVGAAIGRVVGR